MNKYGILLLLFCFSCQSIFHEEDDEYIMLNKRQEKIDMLNGIYSLLSQVHNNDYFTSLIRGDDINIYKYMNYSFRIKSIDGSIIGNCTGGNSDNIIDFKKITGNIYLKLYTAIITANTVIAQSDQNKDPVILNLPGCLARYPL
jgi:hypothetical protein